MFKQINEFAIFGMESWGVSTPPDPPFDKWTSESIWGRSHFLMCVLENDILLLEIIPKPIFFQNGSPGQITVLDTFRSEFCVEPRSQSLDIFHMSKMTIWKLQNIVPGQNVNLNFQVTETAATAASQQFSQSGKSSGPSRPGTRYPLQRNPSLR